ncbi:Hypothetical predicted protein [Cloeon dipterum]|uniref:Cationic amino acid transporter C-terminal domain-containing protein n=1 Tax=Cloeon dipterum TaxID=197152 RepID=A0A8S1DX49_9INSE|nr:Hypothetical predicted protein [Cloeon dipterum]
MAAYLRRFYHALTRRKMLPESVAALLENSQMARVLTTLDLTALGVGSTLGVGVYVLAGSVSKETAGPAVVISFIIAAIASVFAGLCYAEFGARVPKAGSAYVYSYVCVGEFVAFIIGWNLVLEYVVGSASVVRGLSGYVDNLFGNVMAKAFQDLLSIDVNFLSPYIDFFAFGLSLVFAVALALGVKESSNFNNVFTIINLAVVAYVIICGLFKVDIANWSIDIDDIPEENKPTAGKGGFAPFGINGIIKGAATCFYGFVGFDCVATTGEEAKNPQKAIPLAITISLAIIAFAYIGVSTVLTLMWPYYLQDPDAPLPYVFRELGWEIAAWIVSIGAIFGLCASLMGAMLPLPRVLYAMANDGIIFRFLGKIHPRFQTPLLGTCLAGLLTGILAAVFDLQQLVDMMSIGTLLAYSIVAACVLLLRYQPEGDEIEKAVKYGHISFFSQLFNTKRIKSPSTMSASIVTWGVMLYLVFVIAAGGVLKFAEEPLFSGEGWAIALMVVTAVLCILNLVVIGLQPSSGAKLFFRVPLVPLIPGLSIFINIYLMLMLDPNTWIRFAVWMAIGFLMYFSYGIWQSEESKQDSGRRSVIYAHTNVAFEDDEEKSNKDTPVKTTIRTIALSTHYLEDFAYQLARRALRFYDCSRCDFSNWYRFACHMRTRQLVFVFARGSSLIICLLLAQSCGGSDDLGFDITLALNRTKGMAVMVDSIHSRWTELKEKIRTEAFSTVAFAIDSLDTMGVPPSQLLDLQHHSAETFAFSDDLLDDVLPQLINYRALVGRINEHLISDVDAAVVHDLPTLIHNTGHLIALLDATHYDVFWRCDLLQEMILELSDQEVEEVEHLIRQFSDFVRKAFISIDHDKLAFEMRYVDAVTHLRLIFQQINQYL